MAVAKHRLRDPLGDKFPDRLRKIRNTRKLTQRQLASLSGVHKSAIESYEMAYRLPNFAGLIRLARALKVSTDELVGL